MVKQIITKKIMQKMTLLAITLLLCSIVFAEVKDAENVGSKVLTLDNDNWQKMILSGGKNTYIFIYFEKHECKQCRMDMNAVQQLAKHYTNDGDPQIARANCEAGAS